MGGAREGRGAVGGRVAVLGAAGGACGSGPAIKHYSLCFGRHVGGEGGGHGSMWAVGAVGVVRAVWVV